MDLRLISLNNQIIRTWRDYSHKAALILRIIEQKGCESGPGGPVKKTRNLNIQNPRQIRMSNASIQGWTPWFETGSQPVSIQKQPFFFESKAAPVHPFGAGSRFSCYCKKLLFSELDTYTYPNFFTDRHPLTSTGIRKKPNHAKNLNYLQW